MTKQEKDKVRATNPETLKEHIKKIKIAEDAYILGQASIIANILMNYADDSQYYTLQKEFRQLMNDNEILREYVCDAMKNL